jgi:hypothetical protein
MFSLHPVWIFLSCLFLFNYGLGQGLQSKSTWLRRYAKSTLWWADSWCCFVDFQCADCFRLHLTLPTSSGKLNQDKGATIQKNITMIQSHTLFPLWLPRVMSSSMDIRWCIGNTNDKSILGDTEYYRLAGRHNHMWQYALNLSLLLKVETVIINQIYNTVHTMQQHCLLQTYLSDDHNMWSASFFTVTGRSYTVTGRSYMMKLCSNCTPPKQV